MQTSYIALGCTILVLLIVVWYGAWLWHKFEPARAVHRQNILMERTLAKWKVARKMSRSIRDKEHDKLSKRVMVLMSRRGLTKAEFRTLAKELELEE